MRLFWSSTVQLPANSKPFLSHSMASNPAIVRLAVLNEGKPQTFGMFLTEFHEGCGSASDLRCSPECKSRRV